MQVVHTRRNHKEIFNQKVRAINETILFTDGKEDIEKTEEWRAKEIKKLKVKRKKAINKRKWK